MIRRRRRAGTADGTAGARFLTASSLRWVVAHRAWTPWYLIRYWRFAMLRLRHPGVVVRGFVFLDRDVEIVVHPDLGRLVLGRWVHVGAHSALRCHEGTLSIGDKSVLGRRVAVTCFLDVELGAHALVADDVWIADFEHNHVDLAVPVKDQGISKARVRIEPDVWIGTKAVVTSGVVVGEGAVVGAGAVVTRDLPSYGVAVGVPARVVRFRHTVLDATDETPPDAGDRPLA